MSPWKQTVLTLGFKLYVSETKKKKKSREALPKNSLYLYFVLT